jgi:hypothetical protein
MTRRKLRIYSGTSPEMLPKPQPLDVGHCVLNDRLVKILLLEPNYREIFGDYVVPPATFDVNWIPFE